MGLGLIMGCTSPKPRPITSAPQPPAVFSATNPTVILKDSSGGTPVNPISSLLYFVHLISPEPVKISASVGNTQSSRILSLANQSGDETLTVICDFEITGEGTQQNLFAQSAAARRYADHLAQGNTLKRRLDFINIRGAGQGRIIVKGSLINGRPVAEEITMRFNMRGASTPVSIGINDIRHINGQPHKVNNQVVEVNSLTFRRQEGRPKMEVSVASIRAGSSSGVLSSLAGRIKGAVANLFIHPVPIRITGNNAMLQFAQALLEKRPTYTFPVPN